MLMVADWPVDDWSDYLVDVLLVVDWPMGWYGGQTGREGGGE